MAKFRELILGMCGVDVEKLQRALTKKGFYSGVVDGFFSEDTFAAVAEYQGEIGIDKTGIADEITLGILELI